MNSDLRLCCSSLQSEVQIDSHQLPVQMPVCERQGEEIDYRSMRRGPRTVHTANKQRKSGLTLHKLGLTGKVKCGKVRRLSPCRLHSICQLEVRSHSPATPPVNGIALSECPP